ncbi:hypothetical protein AB1Y20_007052 [Prymnesium parvum]|uniref:Uncharacterized protein n=1 Tax=Prymnesium parvum TaxID=97485 RepID=A0AB34J0R9_PRYPA
MVALLAARAEETAMEVMVGSGAVVLVLVAMVAEAKEEAGLEAELVAEVMVAQKMELEVREAAKGMERLVGRLGGMVVGWAVMEAGLVVAKEAVRAAVGAVGTWVE